MATLYQGRSEAEWTQILTELKAEELATIRGDRFEQVSSGGKQYTRRVRSTDQIKADIGEALVALQSLNPTTYGTSLDRTKAWFGATDPH